MYAVYTLAYGKTMHDDVKMVKSKLKFKKKIYLFSIFEVT